MERDVVGGRGEVAVIAAAAVALTGLAALVAGRLRLGLRLLYSVSNLRKLLYLILGVSFLYSAQIFYTICADIFKINKKTIHATSPGASIQENIISVFPAMQAPYW